MRGLLCAPDMCRTQRRARRDNRTGYPGRQLHHGRLERCRAAGRVRANASDRSQRSTDPDALHRTVVRVGRQGPRPAGQPSSSGQGEGRGPSATTAEKRHSPVRRLMRARAPWPAAPLALGPCRRPGEPQATGGRPLCAQLGSRARVETLCPLLPRGGTASFGDLGAFSSMGDRKCLQPHC